MGGLGNIPSGLYESSLFEDLGSVSGTTHSMTHPVANVNDIIVVINNVIQEPTAAYTVSGTTLTTATLSSDEVYIYYLGLARQTVTPGTNTVTNAMMTVNSIDSDQYVDGSIDAAHLSANSVDSDAYVDGSIDNAHLADDAVGVAELSATGTASSSTFLRGDNAWAAAGGGAWTFISSTTVSDDASVTLTGLSSSSYKTYVLVINNLTLATDNYAAHIRYGDSGGIDTGASDYSRFAETCLTSSASFSGAIDASGPGIRMGGNVGNAAGEGFSGTIYLSIGDGSVFPSVYGHYCSSGHNGTQYGATFHGARLSAITTTQVQVIPEGGGGNLVAGTIDFYGISQS